MYLFKYVKKKFNSFQPNLLRKGQFQNTFDNNTDESGSAFFFVYVALRSGTRAASASTCTCLTQLSITVTD